MAFAAAMCLLRPSKTKSLVDAAYRTLVIFVYLVKYN